MLETITIPAGQDTTKEATRMFWSDIYWRTIHCIIDEKNDMSITDIAKAASLTIEETVVALEGMCRIGLLQRTDIGFKTCVHSIKRAYSNLSEREDKVRDFAIATHQVINKLLENPENPSNFTRRVIYNSNSQLMNELISSINTAIDEFKKKSELSQPDGVYAITAAVTPMTQRGIYE